MAKPKLKPGEKFVCKCGGNVIGVVDFGQLWTWCDKCSPVQTIKLPLEIKPVGD